MVSTRRGIRNKSAKKGDQPRPSPKPKHKATSKIKSEKTSSDTDDDIDFEVTVEMMVHDFDEETTMWETEELSEGAYLEELANLEKDNELTIEQLREKYAVLQENYENEDRLMGRTKNNLDVANAKDDDEYKPKKSYYLSEKKSAKNIQPSDNNKNIPARSKRNIALPKYVFVSDREDTDDDYDDSREVKIGQAHQAHIAPIYYTLDIYPPNPFPVHHKHLCWSPFVTTPDNVQNYFNELSKHRKYYTQPSEDYALAHFYKYGCNIDIAIKNIDELTSAIDRTSTKWNVEDCAKFEKGIMEMGKDLISIQEKYLPHKSYTDIVNFYYIWKKSERADQYAVKLKEKSKSKRYLSSVFDYLDLVVNEKKLPYKQSEDGIHYELDERDG